MKFFLAAIAGIVLLAIASTFLLPKQDGNSSPNEPNPIATSGIHWHPQLAIYVKGEHLTIPQNVGVGPAYAGRPGFGDGSMAMTAIHTHDDLPLIHLEFSGLVRESDITLGTFFDVWGKDMRSFGANMRMTVNGAANAELGSYVMHDGDKIELRYD